MGLLDRIANYFKEWDGIDETAPKMELSIHDLRYIADMNVERCRLIRQLNEANTKTQEIREKAITEFAEKLKSRAIDHYSDYLGSNRWVPCEKALPPQPEENPEFDGKPLEVYLVSFKGTKYPWRAFWTGKNFTDGWSIVHPEAWMPLPEPYKPET